MATDTYGSTFLRLRELLGDEALLRLMEQRGGSRVKIPKTARAGRFLEEIVGQNAAEILKAEYGGHYLTVPVNRNFRIVQLRKTGKSHCQISAALCLSTETVRRALKHSRELDQQKTKADAVRLSVKRNMP